MIRTKRELEFFIAADRIMNGRPAKQGIKEILVDWITRGGGDNQILTSNAQVCLLCKYQ